jgi:hypothetical protein
VSNATAPDYAYPAAAVYIPLETKCLAGSLKRGEIRIDCRKWVGAAEVYGLLVTLFWTPQSLLVTETRKQPTAQGEAFCYVKAAFVWATNAE